MIGIVLVGHGRLPTEMVRTAEFIVGKLERVEAVQVDPDHPRAELEGKIGNAVKQVDQGDGVLIITDMFGGTPSNIALSFLEPGRVEVISGMNLPMLLKLFGSREGIDLQQYAQEIKISGQRHISLASEILESDRKKER